MKLGALACLLGMLVACTPDDRVPFAPVAVRVDARDPFGSRPQGDLNVALLWTSTGTIYASPSVVLLEGENTVELPLTFPDPRPPDLFFAEFGLTVETIVVHVPRIAIFRDDDGSGGFTTWNLEEPPPDRIFSTNTQGTTSVAAVRDFEEAFARLTAIDINTYYMLTGGLHTPFLRFAGATSTLTPSSLDMMGGPPIVSMYFEDSDFPEADIRCVNTRGFQQDPQLPPIAATGTSSRSVDVLVDDRIDAEAVCGLTIPDCAAVDISTVTTTVPDDLATAGRRVLSQCRRSTSFESLVTLQAELRCVECRCGWVERQRAIVVRTSSTPDGWPCGDSIDYCPSTLPVFRVDEACFFEEEEEDDGA